jgi:hypothetical protein
VKRNDAGYAIPFILKERAASGKMSSRAIAAKGTVQFPLTKPVPEKLVSRIRKLRAAGIAATAKKTLLGREKEGRNSAK